MAGGFSFLAAAVPSGGTARGDPVLTSAVGVEAIAWWFPLLLLLGCVVLATAWLPLILRRLPLSLPILCIGLGMALFGLTPLADYSPHPVESPLLVEKAAELIVIISLLGAGLKIDRAFRRRDADHEGWAIPLRLLLIAMPLTIGAVMLAGQALLGLPLAAALLLAAALAPTDPVLAADVQIDRPEAEHEGEARFALTAEAGGNDSLAFPFVHLAIAAAATGLTGAAWRDWLLDDVVLRLGVGLAVGVAAGWAIGWLVYRLPARTRLSRSGDGFVALGATLLVYAGTELLHGYGFLAVFVAGLMMRRAAAGHAFNDRLHDFADESERLLMLLLLILFGGMLMGGGLLAGVGWTEAAFAALLLLVIRPVAGWLAMLGVRRPALEKGIIAFYGIRGLGSVFYLAYGLNHGAFGPGEQLWSVLGLVILASVLLHGITVTPLMHRLDRKLQG